MERINTSFAALVWSPETRKDWVSESKKIIEDHQDFSVLVGVAGRTGSGKTSALNAILGYQELLPTCNQEASTAVPCKIAYNNDDNTARAFRCVVTFRSISDLEKQLDQFFDNVQNKNKLEALPWRSHEDEEALRNYNAHLSPTFELIRIIFDIEEEQAEEMDTAKLLNSRRDVCNLLGKKKLFYDRESKGISNKIKPYMDSTEADHGKSGLQFAAWPLIEQVELFVKSDILRNGVVLVDLPGAADAVESRAAVADRYFDQVTATLVVVEARRAASDSTNVELISKHREMAMMLDGKFHAQSYCVCISQIDSIDRAAAVRRKDPRDNDILQSLLLREENLKKKKSAKI
ncbi:hypothetical protein F4802DRAFT_316314 [Xylaria palmicola]|nr:hypothetical protein F4802DRAFT_316314 [Xylaria palmicola]